VAGSAGAGELSAGPGSWVAGGVASGGGSYRGPICPQPPSDNAAAITSVVTGLVIVTVVMGRMTFGSGRQSRWLYRSL